MARGNPGRLVQTKTGKRGKRGKLYNSDVLVNGKAQVRLNDGTLILCAPESLTVYGYFD